MKFLVTTILTICIWSCTTDDTAVSDFTGCLTPDEREVLADLEKLSDRFILANYPNVDLSNGYKLFLDELFRDDKGLWKIDSSSVIDVNRKLKRVYGDDYDEEKANFLPLSSLNFCLKKASNNRFVDKFIKSKSSAGEIGPGIIGGGMQGNNITPDKGLNKIIFITEVVFRTMYFQITNAKSTTANNVHAP